MGEAETLTMGVGFETVTKLGDKTDKILTSLEPHAVNILFEYSFCREQTEDLHLEVLCCPMLSIVGTFSRGGSPCHLNSDLAK